MYKVSMLGLAMCTALAGMANASPMAAGEVRIYNVDVTPLPFVLHSWLVRRLNLPGDATIEVFGDLNQSGGTLFTGLYSFYGADLIKQVNTNPATLDGRFSLKFSGTASDGDVGDANGRFEFEFTDRKGINSFRQWITPTVLPPAPEPSANDVPEPGSMLLVALAGLALGANRRRSATA